MVANEWRNITELEVNNLKDVTGPSSDPLIDVESEQIALPSNDGDWLLTSLAPFDFNVVDPVGTIAESSGSSQGS